MNHPPPPGTPWLAVLPEKNSAALAAARMLDGISAAAAGGLIWLRGEALTDAIIHALRGAAGLEWREPMPDGLWRRPGHRLPAGSMPPDLLESDWHPLSAALAPDMPESVPAVRAGPSLQLRLVRSVSERPANLILTTIDDLNAWTESAPAVRLQRLRFAVADRGIAIVHGSPLPPIAAEPWWEDGGIAIPCGWEPEPALSPALLRRILNVPDSWQGLVLIHPPGTAEHIPGESFASLTRAGARMSAALLHQGGSENSRPSGTRPQP